MITTRQLRKSPQFNKESPIPIPAISNSAPLSRGMFASDRVFIVGGGPSIAGFDLTRLKDEITIGINKAFFYFNPNIIFSMDRRFWRWIEQAGGENGFTPEMQRKFQDYSHGYKVWTTVYNFLFTPDIMRIPSVGEKYWGTDLQTGLGHGNNSGYAALNLASLLGFKEIYLLGYDMKGVQGKQKWFHEGYPIVTADNVYSKFVKNITEFAAPNLASERVKVYNCCKDSGLKCFPYKDIEEISFRKNPLVLCFHTPDKLYSERANKLHASLKRKGYRRKFITYPDQGNWDLNTKMKAKLLLAEMQNSDEEDFIVLDADAIVVGDLMGMVDKSCDIACHLREGKELLSGTLYIKNSPKMRRFVVDWVELNARLPEVWEQKLLHNLIKVAEDVKFRDLPAKYCTIFDLMSYVENPVVIHTQASREAKKKNV